MDTGRIFFSFARVAAAFVVAALLSGCQTVQVLPQIQTSTELGWDRYVLFTIMCEKDNCANSATAQFSGPYYTAEDCEDAGNFILKRTLVILRERGTPPDTMRIVCMPVTGEKKTSSF